MTVPPEELLKRLEHLERRMARLEAALSAGRTAPQASNAEAFRAATPDSDVPPTVTLPDPRVLAPVRTINPPAAPAAAHTPAPAPSTPATVPPAPASTPAAPTAADAPVTERLSPVSAQTGSDSDPFPDLSQLDEKVTIRKGPAQRIEVRAALEDYPRIATRIQQLWGTPECEAYLNNLVIDTRGNRKGFPPAMMEELLYLGRLARVLVILGVGGDMWDAYDQVGDRR